MKIQSIVTKTTKAALTAAIDTLLAKGADAPAVSSFHEKGGAVPVLCVFIVRAYFVGSYLVIVPLLCFPNFPLLERLAQHCSSGTLLKGEDTLCRDPKASSCHVHLRLRFLEVVAVCFVLPRKQADLRLPLYRFQAGVRRPCLYAPRAWNEAPLKFDVALFVQFVLHIKAFCCEAHDSCCRPT
ncbi:putative transmembrane protein [Toxoplasma gondii MAS]|uniref:Putative transmembrane protein n=1 Tax=Toxoplasma gondii MAS TaxID=943118 RepID=A0A086QWW7_TOXGO|nr:putative transmembrane protein [Toxoplasma gondii MAS]